MIFCCCFIFYVGNSLFLFHIYLYLIITNIIVHACTCFEHYLTRFLGINVCPVIELLFEYFFDIKTFYVFELILVFIGSRTM